MMKRFFILFAVLTLSLPSLAHEGHDHGFPAGGAAPPSGPVTLSAAQIETLGLTTEEAILGEIRETLTLPAMVEILPERLGHVSALAAGQITRLFAIPGQAVKRGDAIAQIEPVAVGARTLTLGAPIDGVVDEWLASLGETVEVGRSIATIVDLSRVTVRGAAMESEALSRLANGMPATFIAEARPNASYEGALERLRLQRKPGDAGFGITAAFDNGSRALFPGMTGRLHIALGDAAPAILIPSRAVLGEIADRFVFVRNGDTFERRAVVLGRKSGERVEIIDGVLPGEFVVTQGHYQLQFAGIAAAAAEDDHGHDHDH